MAKGKVLGVDWATPKATDLTLASMEQAGKAIAALGNSLGVSASAFGAVAAEAFKMPKDYPVPLPGPKNALTLGTWTVPALLKADISMAQEPVDVTMGGWFGGVPDTEKKYAPGLKTWDVAAEFTPAGDEADVAMMHLSELMGGPPVELRLRVSTQCSWWRGKVILKGYTMLAMPGGRINVKADFVGVSALAWETDMAAKVAADTALKTAAAQIMAEAKAKVPFSSFKDFAHDLVLLPTLGLDPLPPLGGKTPGQVAAEAKLAAHRKAKAEASKRYREKKKLAAQVKAEKEYLSAKNHIGHPANWKGKKKP